MYLFQYVIVHRLDDKGVVRVGDFGLARDIYSHLYYRADKHSQIPVKWSAPEVLSDGLCTEQSDVVSLCLSLTFVGSKITAKRYVNTL